MKTVKILAASFLAATMAGCGHQNDTIFSCKGLDGRKAVMTAGEDNLTLRLTKRELISIYPYFVGDTEIWHETAPNQEQDAKKNIASAYCEAGILPSKAAP